MILAPSLLSADFGYLAKDIAMLEQSNVDWYHLDIMDGTFVPNISYGFPVIKAVAQKATKHLDTHLMIVDPDKYIPKLAKLGVNSVSVHYEACPHLHRTIQHIKSFGMMAGVAINPHTPISSLEEILEYCHYINVMCVNPGFGGQNFIESSLSKIKRLKSMINSSNLNTLIQADGGVTLNNHIQLKEAGADILVSGNAIFGAEDPIKAIEVLGTSIL